MPQNLSARKKLFLWMHASCTTVLECSLVWHLTMVFNQPINNKGFILSLFFVRILPIRGDTYKKYKRNMKPNQMNLNFEDQRIDINFLEFYIIQSYEFKMRSCGKWLKFSDAAVLIFFLIPNMLVLSPAKSPSWTRRANLLNILNQNLCFPSLFRFDRVTTPPQKSQL